MRAGLIAAALAVALPARLAAADDPAPERPDVDARELGAALGVAAGGGATPGGLRVAASYLYQLSDDDWFDGGLAFTFGSGAAACFRDRADELICDHGAADGVAIDLAAGVRRVVGGQQGFRPWVRPSAAARFVRFGGDELAGVGVIAAAAGGVRARVADTLAVGGLAQVEAGAAWLGRGKGLTPQLGFAVAVTVEVALP